VVSQRTQVVHSAIHEPAARPGSEARESRVEAEHTVGFPKSGLRVALAEEGSRLTFLGRAEPLLLYFVFGTAVAVAVGGSVLVSPQYGLAGVMLFSVLFSPLVVFSAFGAVRLRTTCWIDRASRQILVNEQSYAGALRHEWPLSALRSVLLMVRPPSGLASGGATYELYLDLGPVRYLVQEGMGERKIRRDAQRVGRFLEVPLRIERIAEGAGRASVRHVLLMLALFALPVLVTTAALAYMFRDQPPTTSLTVVSMSALVVCQVGAILAYSYHRSRPRTEC
jgi:hypothetical protein